MADKHNAAASATGPEEPPIKPQNVTTANELAGYRVLRPLGLVRGLTVRSMSAMGSIDASFRSMAGGETSSQTALCEGARREAHHRMLQDAASLGATAVVGVRYDANCITDGMAEVVAYGLALTDGSMPYSAVASDEEGGVPRNMVTTTNLLPKYTHDFYGLGVVQGLTVRSSSVNESLAASLRSLVGGEVTSYTRLCEDARRQAYQRMVAEAARRGADAILAVRYSTNEIVGGVTEVLAYGTAVSSTAPAAGAVEGLEEEDQGDIIDLTRVTTGGQLPCSTDGYSLGLVQGITVRSSHFFANIAALMRVGGGEVQAWSNLCKEARRVAFKRMLQQARERGAKGVVAMRYDCSQIVPGSVEVLCYGTAVLDTPVPDRWGMVHEHCLTPAPGPPRGAVPDHYIATDLALLEQEDARVVGMARGLAVFTCTLAQSIVAGIQSAFGGEIRSHVRVCEAARALAYRRMAAHGSVLNATGIVGVRYTSHMLGAGVMEVVAYGTAVRDLSAPPMGPPSGLTAATAADGVLGHAFASTTNELPGVALPRTLGIVRGITVRTSDIFTSIGAGITSWFAGGEAAPWRRTCEAAREEALARLVKEATALGARGVVGLRVEASELASGFAEVIAYGTAVTASEDSDPPLFGRG